jgi:F5/8 type C domain.
MRLFKTILFGLMTLWMTAAFADDKLTGKVMGTRECVDYSNTSSSTTTVNTCANAFDGNLNTFFASWERNYTWAGLDLGSPHVITRWGGRPRNDSQGPKRVQLGVFEGANREDFMDALPIYLITENGTIGQYPMPM